MFSSLAEQHKEENVKNVDKSERVEQRESEPSNSFLQAFMQKSGDKTGVPRGILLRIGR